MKNKLKELKERTDCVLTLALDTQVSNKDKEVIEFALSDRYKQGRKDMKKEVLKLIKEVLDKQGVPSLGACIFVDELNQKIKGRKK